MLLGNKSKWGKPAIPFEVWGWYVDWHVDQTVSTLWLGDSIVPSDKSSRQNVGWYCDSWGFACYPQSANQPHTWLQ